MGEGFADFHELLFLVKEEDRDIPSNVGFNGAYSSNAYLIGGPDFAPDVINNAYYYGDRRYPYTRDMTKNPLTFKHIARRGSAAAGAAAFAAVLEPPTIPSPQHGRGLGAMLWECYSNLLNDTGAPHLRAGAGAHEALPRRRLQDDADRPDVRHGA